MYQFVYRKLLRVLAAGVVVGSLGASAVSVGQAQDDRDKGERRNGGESNIPSFSALTSNNTLFRYNSDSRSFAKPVRVKKIQGNLIGIDYRSANGLLYGVTDTNNIYTIDPKTGDAKFVSKLNPLSFGGRFRSGVDFNPAADRLRLVGSNDQNFRVNVDTGAVADGDPNTDGVQPDGNIAYATDDPNAGKDPSLTAAAYTNSFAGPPSPLPPAPPTRTTQLYGIDYNLDVLVLQDPPNAGTLRTVGRLGFDFKQTGGFDIFTDSRQNNTAVALSGSSLHTVNLQTGAARKVKANNVPDGVIGIAIPLASQSNY